MNSLLTTKKMMTTYPFEIVALLGRQRAGKDTVADYLVKRYGFVKMSLADPVKAVASEIFGMTEKDRGLLIQIGNKMREIDEDVWLNFLLRRIQELGASRIVIPDVRFVNEYETLSELAWTIRISASAQTRASREGYDPEFDNDPTEVGLLEAPTDYVIHNECCLQCLYEAVDVLMEGVLA